MNTACCVIKPDYMRTTTSMPPTRVCAVCDRNEYNYTESYYTKDVFWLCDDCLKKLKKLLEKEGK